MSAAPKLYDESLQPVPNKTENAIPVAFGESRRQRILLVDDDISVRSSLCEVLVGEEYFVVCAADGQEALNVLERVRIDLVLLDLTMPRLNGWDAYGRMISAYPLLPIIVITARPDQLFLAASAGVGALLEKPIDIPVLLHIMRKLLDEPADIRLARLAGRKSDFTYSGHGLATHAKASSA